MADRQVYRIVRRVGIAVTIALILALIGFLLLPELVWSSNFTNISLHTLQGLLVTMTCAIVVIQIRKESKLSNVLFFTAFLFLTLVHLKGLLFQLAGLATSGSALSSQRIVSILLEILIFFGLIFLSLCTRLWWDREISLRRSWLLSTGLVALTLLVYTVYSHLLFQSLFILLPVIGVIISIDAIALAGLTINLILRNDPFEASFDRLWMVNGLFQFAIAVPIILHSVFFPTQIWILAMVFILCSLLSFNLSMFIRQFIDIGMNYELAFGYTFFWEMMLLLPFLASFILEAIPIHTMLEYSLYLTIRIGGIIVASGIAVLMLVFSRQQKSRTLVPLIVAFFSWSIIEGFLLSSGPLVLITFESLIPYLIGYLIVILLLLVVVHQQYNPSMEKSQHFPTMRIVFSLICVIVAVWASMTFENFLLTIDPSSMGLPIDRMLLLTFSFVNVFWFATLSYLYLRKSVGRITIEIIGLSFLMLWVLPSILKGIFEMWSMGWWPAEFILLIGLLVGPFIFGFAYLRSMQKSEESEKRAKLYSDILAHDIGNYHQAMLTSLEILEMSEITDEVREETFEQIYQSLIRADHLIKNVRQLGKVELMPKTVFKSVDLVSTIQLAADQVFKALRLEEITFTVNRQEGECFVHANLLLVDLFQNLIRNAIEYSNGKNRVVVEINELNHRTQAWWEIRVIDYGRGIPPERKSKLFSRYMDGAHGSGIGLSVVRALTEAYGGFVEVADRVPGDHTKGTCFIVMLPQINEDVKS